MKEVEVFLRPKIHEYFNTQLLRLWHWHWVVIDEVCVDLREWNKYGKNVHTVLTFSTETVKGLDFQPMRWLRLKTKLWLAMGNFWKD